MNPQGTVGWEMDRCGKFTASRAKDVLATVKSGEAASRRDYRYQLAVERLTGQPIQFYKNAAMDWGTDNEAGARLAFELMTGMMVDEVGFLQHPELLAGCSPDGLIGDDEGLEIKCPYSTAIHVQTILDGMPQGHRAQVQGCMWITGRKRWHFVSYDPRVPPDLRLYHEIIKRDEDYIANLEAEVRKFLGEVDELLERLRGRVT